MTLLTVRIEKIGLKDAGQCIDPYMSISVKGNHFIDKVFSRHRVFSLSQRETSNDLKKDHLLLVMKTCLCLCVLPSDMNGVDLNPMQDTPVATRKEDTYIHFNVDVEIQKHIEKLPKGDYCHCVETNWFRGIFFLLLCFMSWQEIWGNAGKSEACGEIYVGLVAILFTGRFVPQKTPGNSYRNLTLLK